MIHCPSTDFHSTHSKSLPPPELPVPNAQEVARFQRLFLARFGVELSEEQAHDQARRLVQFVFLMQHALPYLNQAQTTPNEVQVNSNDAQDEYKKPSQQN